MRQNTALRAGLFGSILCLPFAIHAQTPLPPGGIEMPEKPGAGITLRPAPTVTNMSPDDFVVQGDAMKIRGQFAPHELVVEIGTPPQRVEIIGRSSAPAPDGTSWVIVRLPAGFTSPGAPLRARHGINGETATLASSLRVIARPTVSGFRVLNAPAIDFTTVGTGSPTSFEISVSNYVPGLNEPALHFPNCSSTQGGSRSFRRPKQQFPGNPHRFVFDGHFGPEYAGRLCAVQLYPYSFLTGSPPPDRYSVVAGQVQLPTVATYTIEDTEDLLDHTTASGKRLQATASKGVMPCQLASAGTAGSFSTGVVRSGGDLTFQLRNGLVAELCEFKTSPALEVRSGWFVKQVEWSFSKTSLCSGTEFGFQQPGGTQVSFFANDGFIFPVLFQAFCNPNADDPPRNSHRYMARLARVVLMGPSGQRWQDAFK